MRALSFLPAATRTIQDLGLEELLCGVTFECKADRPRVVRSHLEGRALTSGEIDRAVRDAAARGDTLYWVDRELLAEARADVVFTQEVCDVCQIGTAVVEREIARLPQPPRLVPLVPKRFADVLSDTRTIAAALGRADAGERAIARAEERLAAVAAKVRGAARPRVVFLEWIDPLFASGHWIPDQVALAGGVDVLGVPGGRSRTIAWTDVEAAAPEVIVVAPCGLDPARARTEAAALPRATVVVDAELFTQPSLSSLVEGVELLAEIFHA
jgi:iron complex transport system substrate-binding protein